MWQWGPQNQYELQFCSSFDPWIPSENWQYILQKWGDKWLPHSMNFFQLHTRDTIFEMSENHDIRIIIDWNLKVMHTLKSAYFKFRKGAPYSTVQLWNSVVCDTWSNLHTFSIFPVLATCSIHQKSAFYAEQPPIVLRKCAKLCEEEKFWTEGKLLNNF